MIIAFDTWILDGRYRNTGMHMYADHLFREFQRLAGEMDGITIRSFSANLAGNGNGFHAEHAAPGFQIVQSAALKSLLFWRLRGVTSAAAQAGADLIFSPALHISPFAKVPVVATIHDVMPAKLPRDQFSTGTSLKRGITTRATIRLSKHIITDSECSKRDLIEVYGVPPEKVSVVYLGYDKNLFNSLPLNAGALAAARQGYGIDRPYILHHGMVQRRKNLTRLIEAYSRLAVEKRTFNFQLVLAGPFGWGSQEIRNTAARSMVPGNIIFTGPLQDEELATIIKGAALAVIPSLYEGFCLPLLEAMACGTPVIASNSSCIPEVSAGGLRYFDPHSVDDIAQTILSVLQEQVLRSVLATNGLKQAATFSWERCGRETLAVLADVFAANRLPMTKRSKQ